MKEWSRAWIRSKQPRKQRKYRHNAQYHVRRRFVSAHLSSDLRRQFGRRSFPLRKGDEVIVMRGKSKGYRGEVTLVNLSKLKVRVDGVNVKRVDGSEVAISLEPSNLIITKLNLDDKKRRMALDRAKEDQPKKEKKSEPKPEHKKETKPKEKKDESKKQTKPKKAVKLKK